MSTLPSAPTGDAPVGRAPISIAGSPTALSEKAAAAVARSPEIESRFAMIEGVVDSMATAADAAYASTQHSLAYLSDAQSAKTRYVRDVEREGRDPDTSDLAAHDRAIANARSRHAAAHAAASRATAVAVGSRDALRAARGYLNREASRNIKVVRPPKLPEGVTALTDIVATQRADLLKLAEEAQTIIDAPMREDTARAAIMAKLDAFFERGRPRISVGDRHADIVVPSMRVNAQPLLGTEGVEICDAAALQGYLSRQQFKVAIEESIVATYASIGLALDFHEKPPMLDDIAERRLTIERTEVAAIIALWELENFSIGLRKDSDPRAVVGIE